MPETSLQWGILGNLDNRRVTAFAATLDRPPILLSWEDYLHDPHSQHTLAGCDLVRMESFGEDLAVERLLVDLGDGDGSACTPGRITAPDALFRGLCRALDAWTLRPTAPHPAIVPRLFDKRLTLAGIDVPVPERLPQPTSVEAIIDGVRSRGWHRTFVKLATGSSASGVGMLFTRRQPRFMTSMQRSDTGWFNSLRIQRHDDVVPPLSFLVDQGCVVEQAIDKARLDGAWFDCRVVTILGEPRFVLVRQSRHPITNLHLGGWRGRLDALRERCPPKLFAAAMESCRAVAHAYPGALHLGIDLCFDRTWTHHYILEVNAFGDLLPRLQVDGRTVYGWEQHLAPLWMGRQEHDEGVSTG